MVGTIAGDDTILVVAREAESSGVTAGQKLAATLLEWAGREPDVKD